MQQGYALETVSDIGFFRVPALIAAGVEHGVTARTGGVSEGAYASLNLGWSQEESKERTEENYFRM